MIRRFILALLVSIASIAILVPQASASPLTPSSTSALQPIPVSGTFVNDVAGGFGTFTGTFVLRQITVNGISASATGLLSGTRLYTVRPPSMPPTFPPSFDLFPSAAKAPMDPEAACSGLLHLQPLHLYGMTFTLIPSSLTGTTSIVPTFAQQICQLAHMLPSHGSLTRLAQLLDGINAQMVAGTVTGTFDSPWENGVFVGTLTIDHVTISKDYQAISGTFGVVVASITDSEGAFGFFGVPIEAQIDVAHSCQVHALVLKPFVDQYGVPLFTMAPTPLDALPGAPSLGQVCSAV